VFALNELMSPSVQHRTHQLESFHAPCISYWKTSIVYRWVLKFHQSSWRQRNCFCKISVAILLKQEKATSHLLTNLIPEGQIRISCAECLCCQVGVDACFPCDWADINVMISTWLEVFLPSSSNFKISLCSYIFWIYSLKAVISENENAYKVWKT